MESVLREIDMLKTVRGRNVVEFVGASALCHVTEFMDLGTLTSVLAKHQLDSGLKLHAIKCIAVGMATVHSFNVIHRDLKPDNVLCKAPLALSNAELCKITDFGTSRAVENVFAMTMTKGQGTPLYMAPEILSGQKHYSRAVDTYSFAIVCAAVWSNGKVPYSEYSFRNALEMQNAVIRGCRPTLQDDCPIKELIHRCWAPNPGHRPSFDEIVNML